MLDPSEKSVVWQWKISYVAMCAVSDMRIWTLLPSVLVYMQKLLFG